VSDLSNRPVATRVKSQETSLVNLLPLLVGRVNAHTYKPTAPGRAFARPAGGEDAGFGLDRPGSLMRPTSVGHRPLRSVGFRPGGPGA
jgi:hypothetical protein